MRGGNRIQSKDVSQGRGRKPKRRAERETDVIESQTRETEKGRRRKTFRERKIKMRSKCWEMEIKS